MRTSSPASRRRLALGFLTGLVFAAVAIGAGSAPLALAHDVLETSSPSAGEIVSKHLDTVVLTFSDELLTLDSSLGGFAVQVTDADGDHHESGCVVVAGSVVSTGVALGEAGEYTVAWQVASSDGHPVSGSYTFTWQPSSVTVAAPGFPSAPECDDAWSGEPSTTEPTLAQAATPEPMSSQSPASSGSGSTDSPAATPEPTMTVLGVAQADSSSQSNVALPLAIVLGIGGLSALSAVLVFAMRRRRVDAGVDAPGDTRGDTTHGNGDNRS
ncbi:copper resistance CopC family protein [Subtercola frigoramans]|uniref:Methionine-rich copper-binding protein CopC n=1 Tax=Subtercola frigoramans TaxID=120298 RepID=A0ABS2L3P9_9MICO|nr:copper resistance CopC family protein [Subtercola frigoramans]MBM7471731.1 methionine-rich copper-binding protein CopC [Subtercola frigoramans]